MDIVKTTKEFSDLIENKVFTFESFTYQFKKHDEVSRDFKVNGQSIDKYRLTEDNNTLYVLLPGKPLGSDRSFIEIIRKVPLKIRLVDHITKKATDLGEES